jgi:RNA recognition motif-containing protein
MIKLFVVGYPLDIQETEMIELFSTQGMIHSIHLLTDKETGKQKGFGFIEMVDQAGADRAISALNQRVIRGRKITVKLADENRPQKPRGFRENTFQSERNSTSNADHIAIKTKRPRKLATDTGKSID